MTTSSQFILKTLLFIFIFAIIVSLVRTIWSSYVALKNVQQEEQRVLMIEAETQKMKDQLIEATSSFRLEQRARETLHLQKPGESVIRVE